MKESHRRLAHDLCKPLLFHGCQDHPLEEAEVVEAAEVAVGAEEEEGVERSHYPDTHPLNQLKNF